MHADMQTDGTIDMACKILSSHADLAYLAKNLSLMV